MRRIDRDFGQNHFFPETMPVALRDAEWDNDDNGENNHDDAEMLMIQIRRRS